MNLIKSALMAGAITLLSLQPAFAGDLLSASDLRKLVPGRYRVTLMGTVSMMVTLHPGGLVLGTTKTQHDSGHWNLSGSNLCIAWNKWLGGQARCSQLVSQGTYYQGSGFTFKRI